MFESDQEVEKQVQSSLRIVIKNEGSFELMRHKTHSTGTRGIRQRQFQHYIGKYIIM